MRIIAQCISLTKDLRIEPGFSKFPALESSQFEPVLDPKAEIHYFFGLEPDLTRLESEPYSDPRPYLTRTDRVSAGRIAFGKL